MHGQQNIKKLSFNVSLQYTLQRFEHISVTWKTRTLYFSVLSQDE